MWVFAHLFKHFICMNVVLVSVLLYLKCIGNSTGNLLLVFSCLTTERFEEVRFSWKSDMRVVCDSGFLQLLFLCFSVFTFILVFPQGLTGTDGPPGPNGPPGDRVSTTLCLQCLEMELCHCLHWWLLLPLWTGDTGVLMMAGYLSVNPCRMLKPFKWRPK